MDKLLVSKDVCALLRVSEATLYRMVKRGDFPAPLRLGLRTVRWRESDVMRYLQNAPTSAYNARA
jgi:prophage regulatory protein